MFKVRNPLFSVPSAIPNLKKNNQASPHIMHNEELALTSQMEIPTARTTTVEQTTLNQTMTMTGVDQMVAMTAVDQHAPGTVIDPAAETSTWITTEISNTASPNYFGMTTNEMTTIDAPAMTALAKAPATTAINEMTTILQVDAPAVTAPGEAGEVPATTTIDEMTTILQVDAPAVTAPAEAPATIAIDEMTTTLRVDAPAMTAPADFLVTTAPVNASATISPIDAIVGSGTGKKAEIMRPNPHSTTARYVSLFCRNISVY